MSRRFYMPPEIFSGMGSLAAAGERLRQGNKALIVTGKTVERQPCMKDLKTLLGAIGVEYALFSDIPGEPTDVMVRAGLETYLREGCDFMLAVGGGSPMDLMKAVAVLLKDPQARLRDYLGQEIPGPFVPMIAIPTTAGTGSEATMFTVITDTETDVKMLLKGPGLIPRLAVVDPSFSVTAPAAVTAHTGLDALTHAVESYTSRLAQPLTDCLALDAVKTILTWLPGPSGTGTTWRPGAKWPWPPWRRGCASPTPPSPWSTACPDPSAPCSTCHTGCPTPCCCRNVCASLWTAAMTALALWAASAAAATARTTPWPPGPFWRRWSSCAACAASPRWRSTAWTGPLFTPRRKKWRRTPWRPALPEIR